MFNMWQEIGFTGAFEKVLPIVCSYLSIGDKILIHNDVASDWRALCDQKVNTVAKIQITESSLTFIDKRARQVFTSTIKELTPFLHLILGYLTADEMIPFCNHHLRILNQNYSCPSIRDPMIGTRKDIEADPSTNKMVSSVMRIEDELEGYTCFYHATKLSMFLSILLADAFFATIMQDERPFPPLRFPNNNGTKNIQDHLILHPPKSNEDEVDLYDIRPEIRQTLLCANCTLFSNVNEGYESTWWFYYNNINMSAPEVKEFLTKLFDKYSLVPKENEREQALTQLNNIHKELYHCALHYLQLLSSNQSSKYGRGVILQIAIADELVNDLCYPCINYGVPRELPEGTFSNLVYELSHQQNHSEAAKKARKTIREIHGEELGRMDAQARILIQRLLVPDHRIKLFVHGYGRFFDIKVFAPHLPSHDLPWNFLNHLKQAKVTDKIEESAECVSLIKRKDQLLQKAKELFQQLILKSPAKTKEGAFLSQFF